METFSCPKNLPKRLHVLCVPHSSLIKNSEDISQKFVLTLIFLDTMRADASCLHFGMVK
ncbi:MAG TPA: hypothetical protein IAA99_03005 [Candidatus Avibacteroides faecavium]|nr:hypothetical protein [Candidatus Avibacteroides faecavium]